MPVESTALLDPPAAKSSRKAKPQIAAVEPIAVDAVTAAAMFGMGKSAWWGLHAAARVPAPIPLGGRTLWRIDELRDWAAAGCPARSEWQARQHAKAESKRLNELGKRQRTAAGGDR